MSGGRVARAGKDTSARRGGSPRLWRALSVAGVIWMHRLEKFPRPSREPGRGAWGPAGLFAVFDMGVRES
jgi:hypothetical protein